MQHSCFTGLAEIFRPGLISHPTHELEPSEHRLSQEVLEFLIDHDDWFMLDAPPPPPLPTSTFSRSLTPLPTGPEHLLEREPANDESSEDGDGIGGLEDEDDGFVRSAASIEQLSAWQENEARIKEEEATRKEEEAIRKEEQARRLEEKARQSLEEAKRFEADARQAEANAKLREAAIQNREVEVKRKEVEVKKREANAQKRETGAQRKEENARYMELEAKRKEERVRQKVQGEVIGIMRSRGRGKRGWMSGVTHFNLSLSSHWMHRKSKASR